MSLCEVSPHWRRRVLAELSVVAVLGGTSCPVQAADWELAAPPTAHFELSRPEIHELPSADFQIAPQRSEKRQPPHVEAARPEIAQPPPADFELSHPEIGN